MDRQHHRLSDRWTVYLKATDEVAEIDAALDHLHGLGATWTSRK